MSDTLSILRHSNSLMAKTWHKDGTIGAYGDAKFFSHTTVTVSNLVELSLQLTYHERQPWHCFIRGKFVGTELAQERDGEAYQEGKVRRALAYFDDQPLHSMMVDIDGFEPLGADALDDPLAAIEEFITTMLPASFQTAGYHWQLSNSAGHESKGGKLQAHLWFWLDRALTSAQLKAWAKATSLAADMALFNPVQVHYTARPQFEGHTCNPYPTRSGYVAGPPGPEGRTLDAVVLDVSAELLAAQAMTYTLERPRQAADAKSDDEVVNYLYAQGLVLGTDTEGRLHVDCPNGAEHTTDGVESATSYFPAGVGREEPGFKCLHAHCTDLHVGWFMRAIGFDRAEDDFDVLEAESVELLDPARVLRDALLKNIIAQVLLTTDVRDLEETVAQRVAASPLLTDTDRSLVASKMRDQCKLLGTPLSIATIRGWLKPAFTSTFPHVTDEGYPLGTLENFRVLISRLGIVIRYNVIKKSVEILVPGTSFTRDNKDNAAMAYVLSACAEVRMPSQHAIQFVLCVADENQYNPVLSWIESKPWDGISRLEDLYATVVSDSLIKPMIMRKWLVQCAAAACMPDGISAQGVLVFSGAQNLGKTTWFKNLAPVALDVVLTGHSLDTRNKDSVFTAVGHWIVELGELDATFKKSDIAALKAFITQPTDKLRRPYAAAESQMARRTVLGGSVNEADFLSDPTGNRRFWTVAVEAFKFDHGVDMQQLWAEVLVLAQGGEGWSLDRAEFDQLSTHNEDFTVVDPWSERVATTFAWANTPATADCGTGWQEVTATQIAALCGQPNASAYECRRISQAVRKLNGDRARKSNGVQLLRIPTEAGGQCGFEDLS